jgi:hypothetical protein
LGAAAAALRLTSFTGLLVVGLVALVDAAFCVALAVALCGGLVVAALADEGFAFVAGTFFGSLVFALAVTLGAAARALVLLPLPFATAAFALAGLALTCFAFLTDLAATGNFAAVFAALDEVVLAGVLLAAVFLSAPFAALAGATFGVSLGAGFGFEFLLTAFADVFDELLEAVLRDGAAERARAEAAMK